VLAREVIVAVDLLLMQQREKSVNLLDPLDQIMDALQEHCAEQTAVAVRPNVEMVFVNLENNANELLIALRKQARLFNVLRIVYVFTLVLLCRVPQCRVLHIESHTEKFKYLFSSY
jgi:hypothetical protein